MDHITIITALRELQKIVSRRPGRPADAAKIAPTAEEARLRAAIPTVILGHFDRLARAGRVGVAPVRNGVCGGCHIRVPRAQSAGMRGSHDLDVCDQCGAFLFSEELLANAEVAETVGSASR